MESRFDFQLQPPSLVLFTVRLTHGAISGVGEVLEPTQPRSLLVAVRSSAPCAVLPVLAVSEAWQPGRHRLLQWDEVTVPAPFTLWVEI